MYMEFTLLNKYRVLLLCENSALYIRERVCYIKKIVLSIALSVLALSSHAKVTVVANPFNSNIEVDHELFVKGSGGAQCKGLPRICGQMANCEQAKQALKCGNKRLDRDKDGVPCESICPGG